MHDWGMIQTVEVKVVETTGHPVSPMLSNPGLQQWGL